MIFGLVLCLSVVMGSFRTRVYAQAPAPAPIRPAAAYRWRGVELRPGGFLATETVYRRRNMESDVQTFFARLPFRNNVSFRQPEFRGSERQSRLSLQILTAKPDEWFRLGGFYEIDFMATSPTANPNQTNSFMPRTRLVYLTADLGRHHLLAGQMWSAVVMNRRGLDPRDVLLPASIDTQFFVGFNWERQWQMRWAHEWAEVLQTTVSFENAQTVNASGTLPANVGNTYQGAGGGGFSANPMSFNTVPDVVTKISVDLADYRVEAYGLFRNFRSNHGGTTADQQMTDQSTWSSALGLGARAPLWGERLALTATGLFGSGVGRYGTTQLADATFDDAGALVPLSGRQFLARVDWAITPTISVFGVYGRETLDPAMSGPTTGFGDGAVASNYGCGTPGGTCAPQLRTATEYGFGGWWQFYAGDMGVARVGFNFGHITLETFADARGNAPDTANDVLLTSVRYAPF